MRYIQWVIEPDRVLARTTMRDYTDVESWDDLWNESNQLAAAGPPVVLLDTSSIQNSDCGLRWFLVRLARLLLIRGGKLVVVDARPEMRHHLQVSKLDSVMEIEPATGGPENTPRGDANRV